jgi:hypothetical protein
MQWLLQHNFVNNDEMASKMYIKLLQTERVLLEHHDHSNHHHQHHNYDHHHPHICLIVTVLQSHNSALKIQNSKYRENAKLIYCAAYWNSPLLVTLPSSLPTALCCQLTITRRTKGDNLGAFRAVIVVPLCLSQLPSYSYSSCFSSSTCLPSRPLPFLCYQY